MEKQIVSDPLFPNNHTFLRHQEILLQEKKENILHIYFYIQLMYLRHFSVFQ